MDVKFAIGMIVMHDHRGERDQLTNGFAGVIIGWHTCKDIYNNLELSVNKISDPILPLTLCVKSCLQNDQNGQTHYIVLTENNEMCYVEQGMHVLDA